MKRLLIRYRIGLVTAVVAGILAGFPLLAPSIFIGTQYQGILFKADNDENTYRARIQEILDGHHSVASPNLYEHKDDKGVVPPVNEYFYAIPAMLLGLSFVILLSKFIFPGCIFFLSYLLIIKICKTDHEEEPTMALQLTAVSGGLLTLLGLDALNFKLLLPLITGHATAYYEITWVRLVNPIIGGLLLFLALIGGWKVMTSNSRLMILFSGIVMALSVGYFFSFGLIACVFFASLLFHLFVKDFDVVKRIVWVFVVGILVSLPYWVIALGSMGGTEGKLVATRNGMFFTHEPVINKFLVAVSVLALLGFVYQWFVRRDQSGGYAWRYILIVIVGCWAVFNQQVITGRTIWYHHFAQYTAPLGFLIIMATGYLSFRKVAPRLFALMNMGIIIVVVAMLTIIALSYRYQVDQFIEMQKRQELFTFLNAQPKDCVILILEERDLIEQMIPAYTHCNVYGTTYVFNGITQERILHNFLLRMRLLGITRGTIDTYLNDHQQEVRIYFFDDWTQNFGSGEDEWLNMKFAQLRSAYDDFLLKDLDDQLKSYRMDYIASTSLLPEDVLQSTKNIVKLESFAGYNIYQLTK